MEKFFSEGSLARDLFTLYNPHQELGLQTMEKRQVITLWRPGAQIVEIHALGTVFVATQLDCRGLFRVEISSAIRAQDYRVKEDQKPLQHDPYSFFPTWGEVDSFLFNQGVHYNLYQVMGGRLKTVQGVKGASFSLWAPNARAVFVVGDFNHWREGSHPMRSLGASGVWELFIPGLEEGALYKFAIETADGSFSHKADPYALSYEVRPKTASKLASLEGYHWGDDLWMDQRKFKSQDSPMAIYEVHLASWRKDLTGYKEIAKELAAYVKRLHFTHVELLPVMEHPLDESWGYQVTGFFAPTSRFGSIQEFQWFVDHLHQEGVGVIVDFVGAHFPKDQFALANFDGTNLYEHADPRQGEHPHWQTLIFNYGRKEVSNFLLASALFWLEVMHIDALRVDAVASMLYLDYGREEGDWVPNAYGGRWNLEAIEFLKHLNSIVHKRVPGALMIAEESTAFPGVTTPVEQGGLGFDLKWNMGWMNDTLRYFQRDLIYRCYHQNELTFGILYAFSEKFLLPLSHDEIVHGKRSLLSKMPGDDWQKFANLRLLYSYLMCQPGKKLFFMGGELADWDEWNSSKEMNWSLMLYERHKQVQNMVKDLNALYRERSEFWEIDFSYEGFEWILLDDHENSVLVYLRKNREGKALLCVHHFTATYFERYRIPLSWGKAICEIFSSDSFEYGGSGKVNGRIPIESGMIEIQLPPLATAIFEIIDPLRN